MGAGVGGLQYNIVSDCTVDVHRHTHKYTIPNTDTDKKEEQKKIENPVVAVELSFDAASAVLFFESKGVEILLSFAFLSFFLSFLPFLFSPSAISDTFLVNLSQLKIADAHRQTRKYTIQNRV